MPRKKSSSSVDTRISDTVKVNYDPSWQSTFVGNANYSDIMWVLPTGQVFYKNLDRLTLGDYYYMKNDYQIAACLNSISLALETMDWRIDCKRKKIKQFIESNLRDIWPDLIKGISQAFWAGYSPMVKKFDIDDSQEFKGLIRIKSFKDLKPEQCDVEIDENTGDYLGFKYNNKLIDSKYTFWYTFRMQHGDYYGYKLLKAAYVPYFYSQIVHMFANRYFERFGEPIVVGRAPAGDKVEDPKTGLVSSGMDVMDNIVKQIRNHSSITLSSEKWAGDDGRISDHYMYDIEYLESQMRGADFERYLTRLDGEKSKAIFIPTPELLLSAGRVGSTNLGIEQKETYLMFLNAVVNDLKKYIEKYIIKQLVDYNFGTSAPRAKWVVEALGKLSESTLRAMVTSSIRAGNTMISLEDLSQRLGIRLYEPGGFQKEEKIDKEDKKKLEEVDKKTNQQRMQEFKKKLNFGESPKVERKDMIGEDSNWLSIVQKKDYIKS